MGPVIYARVAKNSITLREIKSGTELTVTPTAPFTTARMLVGEFLPYQNCLKEGIAKVRPKSFLSISPSILIHAIEMNEGGLCEIERRILQEGALGAGAKRATIHEGHTLSDEEVTNLTK